SNRTSEVICAENNLQTCRDWTFELTNLNHYIWCFWLVSLALVLEIPDDQWLRLVALIGEGGQDVLLDRVMASRQPERKIGENLLHAKPYARLLKAIDAPQAQQATLLLAFVKHWYPELNRRGKQQPWWYIYGDPVKHPLEMGSYFGRWCFEAVAAVKVFGLDDSDCIGHEHYPGDLLHPGEEAVPTPGPVAKPGWWARLLGRSG
ncbi:PoNe immunity protein domain-containing protein, partial [Pseudomonas fluorescens]